MRRLAPGLLAGGAVAAALIGAGQADAQSFRSPFSQTTLGNQPNLVILPTVETVYDTNVLRFNDATTGADKDNFRFTPGASVSLNRLFGRTSLRISGSAGYDFNSRFKFLNRARIDFAGGVALPVGAICTVTGDAHYEQFQFDQADLSQTGQNGVIAATSKIQTYNGQFGCERSSGFSPVAGVSYRRLQSSQLVSYDYSSIAYRGGIAYAKPSIGTVTVLVTDTKLKRAALEALTGIDDGTDVKEIDLSLARSVSPRLAMSVGAGYVHANPNRANVQSFSGISFNGDVSYRFKPNLVLRVTASRDVSNENGFSATYVVREDYRAEVKWKLSAKSTVQVAGERIDRQFRGEDLLRIGQPIGRDSTNLVSLDYGYDTLRLLNFRAGISHRWRDSRNTFYDYHATVVSASVGARF